MIATSMHLLYTILYFFDYGCTIGIVLKVELKIVATCDLFTDYHPDISNKLIERNCFNLSYNIVANCLLNATVHAISN